MSWTIKVELIFPLQKYSYFPSTLKSFASLDLLKAEIWQTHLSLNAKLKKKNPKETKIVVSLLEKHEMFRGLKFLRHILNETPLPHTPQPLPP